MSVQTKGNDRKYLVIEALLRAVQPISDTLDTLA